MPIDPAELEAKIAEKRARLKAASGKQATQPTLAEQIEEAKEAERVKRQQEQERPQSFASDLAGGVVSGLKRQEKPKDSGIPGAVGNFAGRTAPIVAGSLGAAALAPEIVAGSLLATAATEFAGVTAAEAGGLALSKMLGGNAPGTVKEGMGEAAQTGLAAAVAGLGLGTAAKVASAIPGMAQTYLKVPVESFNRLFKRPKAIPPDGPASQMMVETKAINALSAVQEGVTQARKAVGKQVEAGLESLYMRTKGKKLFDVRPLAKDIKSFMTEQMQGADPTVRKMMGGDYKKIMGIVQSLEKSPMKDARAMIQLRRELDHLTDFNRRGVPAVESEAGQLAIKRMGHLFRETIDGASTMLNHKALVNANQKATQLYRDYDDIMGLVGTKDTSRLSLLRRIDGLESFFNQGGVKQDLIEEVGRKFPGVKKHVDDLADQLAARSFTRHAQGSPSGTLKDVVRIIASPGNVAKGLKIAGETANVPFKEAGNIARAAKVGKAVAPPLIKAKVGGSTQEIEESGKP